MVMLKLKPWNRIPWLFSDVILTEKLDGHTAMIHIERVKRLPRSRVSLVRPTDVVVSHPAKMDDYTGKTARTEVWRVWAQNQVRPLQVNHDMSGLAAWVDRHAAELVRVLGPGVHSGTWWGYKIRRGYGLFPDDRRFSLFNTERWSHLNGTQVPGLYCAPILWQDTLGPDTLKQFLRVLDRASKMSAAVPGWECPQGVILYHRDGNMMFQYLFSEGTDDAARGNARRAIR